MEDNSPRGTSDSEGKNSEAISDSITSLGDHSSTDNPSSSGLSGNQQINEGNRDTTDSQNILEEGHDTEKEEAVNEEDDTSVVESEPQRDIVTETERKSHNEEEQRKEDDNEPRRHESITAPPTASDLVSSVGGSHDNRDGPTRRRVTWSANLVRNLDRSDDQVRGAGENRQENGGQRADASENGEGNEESWDSASTSNGAGGQNGA